MGQPVGQLLPGWTPRELPTEPVLQGRYCRLERLSADQHAEQLFSADRHDVNGSSWTYLPYGPFTDLASYRAWVEEVSSAEDFLFYAVIKAESATSVPGPIGVLSYMRADPAAGSIEVGHVHYSPLLQRQRAATEAQFVLMSHAFDDLGYRRYEWKCDALNAASRAAAQRLGFSYEGTFRQDKVIKGRSRDTAWYSITEAEWPHVRQTLTTWLAPENFGDGDRQMSSLRGAGTSSHTMRS
jgi:RimJ/RimL family protein N-acetyltransferase